MRTWTTRLAGLAYHLNGVGVLDFNQNLQSNAVAADAVYTTQSQYNAGHQDWLPTYDNMGLDFNANLQPQPPGSSNATQPQPPGSSNGTFLGVPVTVVAVIGVSVVAVTALGFLLKKKK